MDVSAEAPFVVDPDGRRVPEEAVVAAPAVREGNPAEHRGERGVLQGGSGCHANAHGAPGVSEKEEATI